MKTTSDQRLLGLEPWPREASLQDRYNCTFVEAPLCLHRDLFRPRYERANRMNSTKILRCFPHCCPRHASRSYCGSSIMVRVDVPAGGLRIADQTHVFARFCTSDNHENRVGRALPIFSIVSSIQSSENTHGEWIPSRVVTREDDFWIFEVNPSRRWYYSWCSGKTNAQRFSTHKLEVVVLVEEQGMCRVVAQVESTTFTITSFRRSMDSAHFPDADSTNGNHLRGLWLLSSSYETNHQGFVRSNDSLPITEVVTCYSICTSHPFPDMLGLVFTSIQDLPLSCFSNAVEYWTSYRDVPPRFVPTRDVRSIVANLIYHLFFDREISESLDLHASDAANVISDAAAVRGVHIQWLQWLQGRVYRFLVKHSTTWNSVVSLAAQGHRSKSALYHLHPFSRDNFAARVRMKVVNQALRVRDYTGTKVTDQSLAGVWVSESRSTEIVRLSNDWEGKNVVLPLSVDDLPVTASIVFLQQLGRICIQVSGREVTIWSLQSGNSKGCRLVLDGSHRCCNSLPNGESGMTAGSLLGGQCFGDYFGWIEDGGSIHMTWFSWSSSYWVREPPSLSDCAYRWQWHLQEDRAQLIGSLRVFRGIPATTREVFACMKPIERAELVREWRETVRLRTVHRRAGGGQGVLSSVY